MSDIDYEPLRLLQELEKEAGGESLGRPHDATDELPLDTIQQLTGLFQFRGLDEHHIGGLIKAIRSQGKLEPVIVAWVGNRAILIDGHHRMAAYQDRWDSS